MIKASPRVVGAELDLHRYVLYILKKCDTKYVASRNGHKDGSYAAFAAREATQTLCSKARGLGLHKAGDQWPRFGANRFSHEQMEERKQVWWSCLIVEQ